MLEHMKRIATRPPGEPNCYTAQEYYVPQMLFLLGPENWKGSKHSVYLINDWYAFLYRQGTYIAVIRKVQICLN